MNLSLPHVILPSVRCLAFGLCAVLLHSPMAQATPIFEPLQAFVLPAKNPQAKLIQGSDGNFYGTTYHGGSSDNGTVFKMTPAGALTTLVSFNSTNGKNPYAGLVQGSDGNFYGTTESGGSGQYGTVFKMTPDGILTTLVNFNAGFTHGNSPRAALVQGGDGNFYGTTPAGGSFGSKGTVFKMTTTGALTTLVNFTGSNGIIPYAGLVQGSDGNFYGTTYGGGTSGKGTVFKMTPAGALTTLVSFNSTNGTNPYVGLVQGSDGNFYGTTNGGGGNGKGTVFKMTPVGELTTLVNFTDTNGSYPRAGLVQGSDGNFYGTTYGGGTSSKGTIFKMTPAGGLTTLVDSTDTNGNDARTELVQGSDGNFYGTTSGNYGSGNNGTVFTMTAAGALTILVNFTDSNGSYPRAGLVQGSDGDFYGTTSGANIQNGLGPSGSGGTVFKMTSSGTLTTLVKFDSANGNYTQAGLVQGRDGNFYGTTTNGGSNGYVGDINGYGTVFKMTPAGVLTTLVNFTGTGGSHPEAGLVQGSDGNFYGTTYAGGNIILGNIYSNYGTIFKMTPAGALTTLVSFVSTNWKRTRRRIGAGQRREFLWNNVIWRQQHQPQRHGVQGNADRGVDHPREFQ